MRSKVLLYCKRNGITEVGERDFIIADMSDGSGPCISEWNLPIPRPTDSDLARITDAEVESEQAAARAAAEAIRLATPIKYDQVLQARIETPATDGHVYGIEVDPTGDELIPVQRESTRLTQAEYEAARAIKLAARATHRANMAAIKTDLDQVEAALDQVDVTTTGPLGVAVVATTGVNKTALQEVRKVLVDMKAAAKNLRQASEKMRKEIK